MMNCLIRKKKAAVLAIWLLVLGITAVVFTVVENGICYQRAQKEMIDLSVTVADQISVIARDDMLTRLSIDKMAYDRIRALAFALGDREDIRLEKDFLDEYAQYNGAESLTVTDRDGNTLYQAGNAVEMDSDTILKLIDPAFLQELYRTLDQPEKYIDTLFMANREEVVRNIFVWSTDDSRLLVRAEIPRTKEEQDLIDYFSWQNNLQRIKIGRTGFVLALDDSDGAVLSFPKAEMAGEAFDRLDVRLEDQNKPVSFSELQDTFQSTGKVTAIRVDGGLYYAARVPAEHGFMLALLPAEEVQADAGSAISLMILLIAMITGICVVYILLHLPDPEEIRPRRNGKCGWRTGLAAKLKVAGILAVLAVAVLSLYLEALSAYAETFRYTRNKVNSVVELLENHQKAEDTLTEWFSSTLKGKSDAAGIILRHTQEEKQTPEFLAELSKRLDLRYIVRYDKNGKVIAASMPYLRDGISSENPFHIVLDGRPSYIAPVETDPLTDNVIQKAGVSLSDEAGISDGMILTAIDVTAMKTILSDLGYENVFEQISLTDDTTVIAINDDDMKIRYIAEIERDHREKKLNGFDYTGYHISAMGISEAKLRDNFDGDMLILDNRYFASVRRMDDKYLVVMRPQVTLNEGFFLPVGIATVSTLIFMALVIGVACSVGLKKPAETETALGSAAPAPKKNNVAVWAETGEDVLAMLGGIIHRKKPFFEERWPEDCAKWKDRSSDSKFSKCLNFILLIALAAMIIHATIAGDNSIFYTCMRGNWDSGINLYSLTSCLLTIAILFVLNLVIHKLLFLIARAANAKGETICNLLDSFTKYVLVISGFLICLGNFGVSITELTLTGGVLGVVFGIGCQSIVADIVAGILMTCEGVAHVGDFVSFKDQSGAEKYGTILSIGVRTTKIKWFSEITIMRNNEFKNYIYMPSEEEDRIISNLAIDIREPLERVEHIIQEELPKIHTNLCRSMGEEVAVPYYRGLLYNTDNGYVLSFAAFCKGKYYRVMSCLLNRELRLMCERNNIRIAMPQVIVHESAAQEGEAADGGK